MLSLRKHNSYLDFLHPRVVVFSELREEGGQIHIECLEDTHRHKKRNEDSALDLDLIRSELGSLGFIVLGVDFLVK